MFSIPQSIKPFLKKVSMKLRRLEAACFRQFHGKDVSFVFNRCRSSQYVQYAEEFRRKAD